MDLQHPRDFPGRWPHPSPEYLLSPFGSGSLPAPYDDPFLSFSDHDMPLLRRILPLLALALMGMFNTPRRAVEMVMKFTSTAIHLAERTMYHRFATLYRHRHPAAAQSVLEDLDQHLNPIQGPPAGPKTIRTAMRHLGVDQALVVHPQCRNHECSHVFYEI